MRVISDEERLCRVVEANVFFQIVRDLCIDLYNIPIVREKCRGDYLSMRHYFDMMDKRARRNDNKGVFEKKNEIVADIADIVQPLTDECRSGIEAIVSEAVVPEKVSFATLVGMVSGFIDCIQQINLYLRRRRSQEFDMVTEYLKHTEKSIRIESRDGSQPDFAKMNETMVSLFKAISRECVEYTRKSLQSHKKNE